MSLLKQRQPQLNNALRKKIKFSVREEDYNQKWYIFELANAFNNEDGVDAPPDATQSDFVGTLLGALGQGVNIANVFLKPSKWFTDKNTGEEGVMNLSRDSIRRVGTPDIDNYLSKFIFKENIDAYTNTQFPTRNRVFFAMREKPNPGAQAGAFKLEYDEVYLIYDYEDIFNDDNNATYAQTKITLLRFDSNVAKNSADQYLEINFWLGGIIPTADAIRITPTTLTSMFPNPIEIVDNNSSVLVGNYENDPKYKEPSLVRWQLEHLAFKKPEGGFSFTMYSYMASEFIAHEEMARAINVNNNVENAAFLTYSSFNTGDGEGDYEFYIPDSDYNRLQAIELIGLGPGRFYDDFVDAVAKDWYTGGFESNLTQLGQDTYTEELGYTEAIGRDKENWSSQSRWWTSDIFFAEGSIVVEAVSYIELTTPRENKLVFTEDYLIEFVNDFWKGDANIDGLNPITQIANPIENNFTADINLVNDDYGMCLVNYGSLSLRKTAYEKVSFSYKEIDISPQFLANDPRMKIPNLADSLGGGVKLKKELFSGKDTAPEFEPEKSGFVYSWGTLNTIQRMKFRSITGRWYLEWLANGELATGTNTDGELVTIPKTLYKSPQEISTPDATEINITFIA